MAAMVEVLDGGGVTSPRGFKAGAIYAGVKTAGDGILDLGILFSEEPATVAGTFSTNKVVSPSLVLTRDRTSSGIARAVVANSGCANCCVGDQGLNDAKEMTALTAKHLGLTDNEVLIASTGLIGVELPMALIRQNIGNVVTKNEGGTEFAKAIMTSDTRPKEVAVAVEINGSRITVGGAAKGSGMIHPNMATMLGFITTDANIDADLLKEILVDVVDSSFNMIDVDGDQSTNDTVLLLANGAASGSKIKGGTNESEVFKEAVRYIAITLSKELARDGEGAQKLVEVIVEGAQDISQARKAAREIASSLLVKAMIHGRDPNWGRVMMALGRSGIEFIESQVDVFINDIHIVHEGKSIPYLVDAVVSAMNVDEIQIRANINTGTSMATAWGCDLTEEYVTFNSAYST
tara:strand:+ start:27161 stop:28378 length:1218 start_codon:yes stop_codon:yes gene_type:complete